LDPHATPRSGDGTYRSVTLVVAVPRTKDSHAWPLAPCPTTTQRAFVVQATELALWVSFSAFHVLVKVVERTSSEVCAVVATATQRRS
jgi:hypothetical protein